MFVCVCSYKTAALTHALLSVIARVVQSCNGTHTLANVVSYRIVSTAFRYVTVAQLIRAGMSGGDNVELTQRRPEQCMCYIVPTTRPSEHQAASCSSFSISTSWSHTLSPPQRTPDSRANVATTTTMRNNYAPYVHAWVSRVSFA